MGDNKEEYWDTTLLLREVVAALTRDARSFRSTGMDTDSRICIGSRVSKVRTLSLALCATALWGVRGGCHPEMGIPDGSGVDGKPACIFLWNA